MIRKKEKWVVFDIDTLTMKGKARGMQDAKRPGDPPSLLIQTRGKWQKKTAGTVKGGSESSSSSASNQSVAKTR